jgi:cytochrome c oxidase subunit IV
MKALIIYALTWFLVLAAAGVAYLSGYFNQMTGMIFSLIVSTLFFAGVVLVLPFWMNERHALKY